MPNHVHLILVPPIERQPATAARGEGRAPADSLRACLGEAHRRDTRGSGSRLACCMALRRRPAPALKRRILAPIPSQAITPTPPSRLGRASGTLNDATVTPKRSAPLRPHRDPNMAIPSWVALQTRARRRSCTRAGSGLSMRATLTQLRHVPGILSPESGQTTPQNSGSISAKCKSKCRRFPKCRWARSTCQRGNRRQPFVTSKTLRFADVYFGAGMVIARHQTTQASDRADRSPNQDGGCASRQSRGMFREVGR